MGALKASGILLLDPESIGIAMHFGEAWYPRPETLNSSVQDPGTGTFDMFHLQSGKVGGFIIRAV